MRTIQITGADTCPRAMVARRESLSVAISRLNALIQRAEEAPLPSSYRTLGANSLISAEPQTLPLLDSLTIVERGRAAYGAVGATDPGYAALSSKASEIGRSITS